MTREEAIKELSVEYLGDSEKIREAKRKAIEALKQEPCEDCISRENALRVAKNEYLRGWHNALRKALSEKYSIHCEEGNFSVIQEETIKGLGLSMDCALGKDVESYMSTMPSPQPRKGHWIEPTFNMVYNHVCGSCEFICSSCNKIEIDEYDYCPNCGADMRINEENDV
jgi:hypothetical protein